jgi:hypothetical protein
LEAELTAHIGGNPSIVQKLLIERLIRIRLQLDLLDEKVGTDGWTAHDGRTYGDLLNAYRLCCREVGIEPKPAQLQRTVQDIMTDLDRGAA